MADGAGATAGFPSSNRGVSEYRNEDGTLTVGIDWLSASVDLFAALHEAGFLMALYLVPGQPGHGKTAYALDKAFKFKN